MARYPAVTTSSRTSVSHSRSPYSVGAYSSQPCSPTNVTCSARTGTSPTVDLLRGHEREGRGRQVGGGQRPQDVAGPGPHSAKHTSAPLTSASRTSASDQPRLPSQPAEVVRAEGGAGDDPEPVVAEAGDGHVHLDAAALVEALGVRHVADLAGDVVVADPFEERRGVRTGDVDLRERRLVEQGGASPGREVLDRHGRRPVPARPAARPQRLDLGARRVPVVLDPLPARLLAEHGAVGGVPAVDRRRPRAAGPPGAAGSGRRCRSTSRRSRPCAPGCTTARRTRGRSGGCPCARRRARGRRPRSSRRRPCRCRRHPRCRARRSRRRRRSRRPRSRPGRTRCPA